MGFFTYQAILIIYHFTKCNGSKNGVILDTHINAVYYTRESNTIFLLVSNGCKGVGPPLTRPPGAGGGHVHTRAHTRAHMMGHACWASLIGHIAVI